MKRREDLTSAAGPALQPQGSLVRRTHHSIFFFFLYFSWTRVNKATHLQTEEQKLNMYLLAKAKGFESTLRQLENTFRKKSWRKSPPLFFCLFVSLMDAVAIEHIKTL